MISSERIDKDLRIPNNTQETGCYFFLKLSQKSIFLKSGSMVTGLSKAWLGVNNTATELSFGDVSLKAKTISKTFNGERYYQYYDSSYAFPYIFTSDPYKKILFFTVELADVRLTYNSNDSKLTVSIYGSKHGDVFEVYEYQTYSSAQSYYAQGVIDYGSYMTYGNGGRYFGVYDDTCKITYYFGALYLSTNNSVITVNSGTLTYTYYYI